MAKVVFRFPTLLLIKHRGSIASFLPYLHTQTIPKIERLEDKLDIIMMGKVDVLENDVEQLKNQNGEMVSLVCELDERIKSIKRAVENTIDILTDSFNN